MSIMNEKGIFNNDELVKAYNAYLAGLNARDRIEREIEAKLKEITDAEYMVNIHDELVKSKNYKLVNEFEIRHPDIKEITALMENGRRENETIKDGLVHDDFGPAYAEYIILNNERLVDLKRQIDINITLYNKEVVDFIVEALKTQGCFIGYVSSNELPLLMVIKEDIEKNVNFNYDEDLTAQMDEAYFAEDCLASVIREELEKARMTDKKENSSELPFILNSNQVQEKWRELDSMRDKISKEQYKVEYYKLLLLFGNDVEKVYAESQPEDRDYVIDAYCYYSEPIKSDDKRPCHFRTASPIINQEVLKRKVLKKEKVD